MYAHVCVHTHMFTYTIFVHFTPTCITLYYVFRPYHPLSSDAYDAGDVIELQNSNDQDLTLDDVF